MNPKKLIPYLTVLAVLSGGIFWIHNHFSTAEAVDRVQSNVEKVQSNLDQYKAKQAYEKSLSELFFWREQTRRHPNDIKISNRLVEAEAHVHYLKKQL